MRNPTLADAAIAANRFGLGARPGELAKLASDARGELFAQIKAPAPLLTAALPSSSELLAKVIALRKGKPGAQAGPAAPPAGSVVAAAKGLREIYLPAYLGDVTARFRSAVTSQRSFVERLVHFWSNHFAVSVDKAVVLGLAGPMEREAIRPHVLGKFQDMLLAVEQHPAMLLYLDNAQSVGPDSKAADIAGRRGRKVGLNENLGREILELHTLGVDAGYTQDDVRALASIITGWSIGGNLGRLQGGDPGSFYFREILHQPGKQVLLGKTYKQDGMGQGEAALRDLAANPHTARHISTKLARHFIADDLPDVVVNRLTTAFEKSHGDLPTVYRALLDSPEAWALPAVKFKTPSEYLISTYRALDLPVAEGRREVQTFELLGQRNFQPGSPAGWPDRSADWDGSAALLKRLEWVQALGQRLGADHNALLVADSALGASLHADTRRAIERAQDGPQAMALLLSSPDFMRR
ncbi:MAG: DUF1800 domain-containing protein [Pseudomonadota bacterium]